MKDFGAKCPAWSQGKPSSRSRTWHERYWSLWIRVQRNCDSRTNPARRAKAPAFHAASRHRSRVADANRATGPWGEAERVWQASFGQTRTRPDIHGQALPLANAGEFFQAFPVVENSPPRGP